jgi:hypothetical protein
LNCQANPSSGFQLPEPDYHTINSWFKAEILCFTGLSGLFDSNFYNLLFGSNEEYQKTQIVGYEEIFSLIDLLIPRKSFCLISATEKSFLLQIPCLFIRIHTECLPIIIQLYSCMLYLQPRSGVHLPINTQSSRFHCFHT